MGSRPAWRLRCPPSAQEAKEIGRAGGRAHEHGHLVPVGDLDLEGKGAHSEAGPGALRWPKAGIITGLGKRWYTVPHFASFTYINIVICQSKDLYEYLFLKNVYIFA